ncbi:alkaline phosphatase [Hyphomonas johnsonii MHS-2]|uniref:Alkaline phosphatase n=2 Tax=Hyphomonas johnsonii TaxID=81031 RepID=A0A059FMW0_9PROT|nr:alkaline phosphatase [Hyphomonas johnsonii MHS-2]
MEEIMSTVTRRGLLGAAATGALSLAACATPAVTQTDLVTAPSYDGEVEFGHGVASGDPLPTKVILWTRVTPKTGTGPIPVRFDVYSASSGETPIHSGIVSADPSHDYCVKVDVTGLTPATSYTYRFAALTSAGEVVSPSGRTRTTAMTGTTPVKLGVASCANWQFGYFHAYKALAQEPGLDAIVFLGDYLYEYGIDGYGGETAKALGRPHEPVTEIITLDDYRTRHAQYKTDPNLQAAHANVPWICTWDDHESCNDSYRTGGENHNPDQGEGDWSDRKQAAIQAYFEWMPMREPESGNITSAVWRAFTFGDVATVYATETRLTGRSPSVGWSEVLSDATGPDEVAAQAMAHFEAIHDPARTMMGAKQEAWLTEQLAQSVAAGKTWQVLANQVVMARVAMPNFAATLTPEQIAAQTVPQVQAMIPFSAMGLPWNLDAWDGYPAARERLYDSVQAAGARLVTLAGDTHTAWANTLADDEGKRVGVEFACASISSPGMGDYISDIPDLGERFAAANSEVDWFDPWGHGYTLVTLTPERVTGEFVKVSTITDPDFDVTRVATYQAVPEEAGVSALSRV